LYKESCLLYTLLLKLVYTTIIADSTTKGITWETEKWYRYKQTYTKKRNSARIYLSFITFGDQISICFEFSETKKEPILVQNRYSSVCMMRWIIFWYEYSKIFANSKSRKNLNFNENKNRKRRKMTRIDNHTYTTQQNHFIEKAY